MRRIPIGRSLLALVAVLPMFMPSGMCLCQLVPCSRVATPTGDISPTPEPAAVACACHHPGIHDRGDADHDGDETVVAVQSPNRVPDPDSCPQDHRSDCPVLTGLSLRVAVLPDLAADQVCPPVCAADWAGPRTAPAITRGPPESIATPNSPLFISHCTLLI